MTLEFLIWDYSNVRSEQKIVVVVVVDNEMDELFIIDRGNRSNHFL